MSGPSAQFWSEHYRRGETGWDRGAANPQLLRWLDAGGLQPCRIVVPGCGSGWEVVELAQRGFAVTGLDYAQEALDMCHERLAAAGLVAELVQADVLEWQAEQPFAAIYEQTCLCALHPDYWVAYAHRLRCWIREGGDLFILAMQAARPQGQEGFLSGPPYHCDIHAMRALFDQSRWEWDKPPYPVVPHPLGVNEIALRLRAR